MKENLLSRKSVIRVSEFLKQFNKNINLITLSESARTAKDAAGALDTEVGSIVKSLYFKDSENNFYLCLISGDKYLSIKKLSNLINSKVIKANAKEVKDNTGFSIGGVSPFTHTNNPKAIYIDINLNRFQHVFAAAGNPHVVFEITLSELIEFSKGEVTDIVD